MECQFLLNITPCVSVHRIWYRWTLLDMCTFPIGYYVLWILCRRVTFSFKTKRHLEPANKPPRLLSSIIHLSDWKRLQFNLRKMCQPVSASQFLYVQWDIYFYLKCRNSTSLFTLYFCVNVCGSSRPTTNANFACKIKSAKINVARCCHFASKFWIRCLSGYQYFDYMLNWY